MLGSSRTSAVHPGSALPAPPSCVCTSQQVLVRLCGLCSQPNLQRDNTFSKRKALLRHQLLCCQPVVVPWVSLMLPPSAACHCRLCPEPGHLPQATCVGSAALHEPGLCTACLQAGCVPWQAAIASYPSNCLMLSVQVLGAACSCSACTSSAHRGQHPHMPAAGIAEVCHQWQVPLIVDEAHGSHFCFHQAFPQVHVYSMFCKGRCSGQSLQQLKRAS